MYYESSGNLVNPMAASVTDRMFIRMMILYIFLSAVATGFYVISSFDDHESCSCIYISWKCISWAQEWPANFSIAQFMFLLSCALGGWRRAEKAEAASASFELRPGSTLLFYCTFLSQRHFALLGAEGCSSSSGDYRWLRSEARQNAHSALSFSELEYWATSTSWTGVQHQQDLSPWDDRFQK